MLLLHTLLRRQLHDYVFVAVVVALVRVCNDKIVFSIYFLVNYNNKWISLPLRISENYQRKLAKWFKCCHKTQHEISHRNCREEERGREREIAHTHTHMHECIQQFVHQFIHQYIHSAFVSNYLDFFGQISSETGPQLAANDFEKRPDRRFKFNWQSLIKGSSTSSPPLSLSSQLTPSLSVPLRMTKHKFCYIYSHTMGTLAWQWRHLVCGTNLATCTQPRESLKREWE